MDTFDLRKFLKENKVKEPINEETLKGAIEKEMEANAGRFETPFPTRDLRQILNTKNPEDLPSSAKKVLDKLKKKYKIKEATIINPGGLLKEYFGNDIENYISIIGYDTYDQFFEDNPGAVNAMEEFIFKVPEFRKQLIIQGYEDVARLYEATILNPEDLPGDEEGYITDSTGQKIKIREFDDESIEQYGDAMKQALGSAEAPPHITALAIAAEDAYEEMGNVDEVLKFVEMHLKGAYGD